MTASEGKWLNSWKRSLMLLLNLRSRSNWTMRFSSGGKRKRIIKQICLKSKNTKIISSYRLWAARHAVSMGLHINFLCVLMQKTRINKWWDMIIWRAFLTLDGPTVFVWAHWTTKPSRQHSGSTIVEQRQCTQWHTFGKQNIGGPNYACCN